MPAIELRVLGAVGEVSPDVRVEFAQAATVGDIADALGERLGIGSGMHLLVQGRPSRTAGRSDAFLGSDYRRGDLVALAGALPRAGLGTAETESTPDRLVAVDGRQAQQEFVLQPGSNFIGRDPARCSIVLDDESVSAVHAEVVAGEPVEIIDQGSTNRVVVDGGAVQKARLDAGCLIRLGDTVLRFEPGRRLGRGHDIDLRFNRSPRVAPPFDPEVVTFPEAPGSRGRTGSRG